MTSLAVLGLGELLGLGLLGFALSAGLSAPLIRWLAARQFGKAIRADGPQHQAKSGTPTMGGAVMIGLLVLLGLVLLAGPDRGQAGLVLLGLLAFTALGWVDDLAGLARRSGKHELGVGLKARHMFALQGLAAFGLTLGWLRLLAAEPTPWGLPPALLGLLAFIAILGTVNGVNLSDGLDGLAAGLLAIAFGGLLALGLPRTPALLSAGGMGVCAGFWLHNRYPAKVFMGNLASMGLGLLLALCALLGGKLLLLPVLGAVFLAEVLSDLIQVGWFKWTRRQSGTGRRVFRMAPLHHHYEALGWPELKVVHAFWAAGLLAALLALALNPWLS